jgi:hypothetical protein
VNEYPVPGNAILLSAATRVLAVEQLAAVRIPDPVDPGQAITDGPGFRVELDVPDRDGRLLLSFGLPGYTDPAAAAAAVRARQRDDLALLREWRDLDVELEAYELPWWAARIPVGGLRNATVRWSSSRWVLRLIDPLYRHVDLPARRAQPRPAAARLDAGGMTTVARSRIADLLCEQCAAGCRRRWPVADQCSPHSLRSGVRHRRRPRRCRPAGDRASRRLGVPDDAGPLHRRRRPVSRQPGRADQPVASVTCAQLLLLLIWSSTSAEFGGALHQLQRRSVEERHPVRRVRLFASLLEETDLD